MKEEVITIIDKKQKEALIFAEELKSKHKLVFEKCANISTQNELLDFFK